MNIQHKSVEPSIARIIRQNGDNFSLIGLDSNNYLISSNWIESMFSVFSWGRIDWASVPNSICLAYSDDLEVKNLFEKIAHDYNLSGEIVVSWSNALKLPVKIDISLAFKYVNEIFEEDWDTWIYSEQYSWCIEVHHSGEVCFGYSQKLLSD
jgi:hypothetical protein